MQCQFFSRQKSNKRINCYQDIVCAIIADMKRKLFFIIPSAVLGAVILAAVLFILFLTIVEYRPKPVEDIPFTSGTKMLIKDKPYSLMSWNIGYAGLGKDEDFFMDGGKKVRPDSKQVVEKYFDGIKKTIGS